MSAIYTTKTTQSGKIKINKNKIKVMYYKITNKQSEVYKKLHKLLEHEQKIGEENRKAVNKKVGYKFEKFLGYIGQQNMQRTTQYSGFVFILEPNESIDTKVWKSSKEHAGCYVPNTRTAVGREMSDFLSNGLQKSNFQKVFSILNLKLYGKFTFPFVKIAPGSKNTIILYLDDNNEPKDENVIEITKREFDKLSNK